MTPACPLAIVIINYRGASLVADALASIEPQLEQHPAVRVIVTDNASGDGSDHAIEQLITQRGWGGWVTLVRNPLNGGFSYGNNRGVEAADRLHRPTNYLLLNSDTLLRPGAIGNLLAALDHHPDAGLIGCRLEWPDGRPQESCFRFRTPLTELIHAAATGLITRALCAFTVARGVPDAPVRCDWVSFAAVLVRRTVFERIGPMDEGYFMYFEDIDFCRRARRAGFAVVYDPAAHIVHLRGGSSNVKANAAARKRLPEYYYASRSRYFARFYGRPGLWLANACWLLGRSVSLLRELTGRPGHLPQRSGCDIWLHAWSPLKPRGVRP